MTLTLEDALDAKKSTTTTVQTRTLTKRITRTLTRDEELVVRMTRGLSEGPAHELEFRGAGHPELSAQLALIEASLVAELAEMAAPTRSSVVDTDLKGRILDKLSKLSE